VLRRRVDLRWRLQPAEIERLCAFQLGLLAQAAALLQPDGVLVYSTCSLEPEENSGVVDQFLAGHPGFQLETQRQLLPFANGVDGAYVARLKRT
jgi:16S rRNA (cytosine967-C5)-methyltransferase